MTKLILTFILMAGCIVTAMAQGDETKDTIGMDRTAVCRDNYRTLFGREALTGQGTDPEMMDILQKFIFGEVFRCGDLDIKTRELITCVTLASIQALPQLKAHAGAALNVGVKPIELREAMYLTAPFIGFPKMLNAVGTVNEVFADRGISLPLQDVGIVDESDRHERGSAIQDMLYPGGISGVMAGVPGGLGEDVEQFLTDYFFGEIYTRGAIDLQTRELLGYCILTAIGAESQLRSHYHGCINAGNAPETVAAAVVQCLPYVGFPAGIKALGIIKGEAARADETAQVVRLSRIVVDPEKIDEYNAYLREEITESMAKEPGVLTLYATSERDNPSNITILEIYASREAYQSHLQTPHFKKYKEGTLAMVKDLKLIDSTPIIPGLKIK